MIKIISLVLAFVIALSFGIPKPCRLEEMILQGEYSVNDLVEKYGPYEKIEAASNVEATGIGYIRVDFKKIQVMLQFDWRTNISFLNDGSGGFWWGGENNPIPTEADKDIAGRVYSIFLLLKGGIAFKIFQSFPLERN